MLIVVRSRVLPLDEKLSSTASMELDSLIHSWILSDACAIWQDKAEDRDRMIKV
jgi:hypothetical protein